jgi:hypothetical protein
VVLSSRITQAEKSDEPRSFMAAKQPAWWPHWIIENLILIGSILLCALFAVFNIKCEKYSLPLMIFFNLMILHYKNTSAVVCARNFCFLNAEQNLISKCKSPHSTIIEIIDEANPSWLEFFGYALRELHEPPSRGHKNVNCISLWSTAMAQKKIAISLFVLRRSAFMNGFQKKYEKMKWPVELGVN